MGRGFNFNHPEKFPNHYHRIAHHRNPLSPLSLPSVLKLPPISPSNTPAKPLISILLFPVSNTCFFRRYSPTSPPQPFSSTIASAPSNPKPNQNKPQPSPSSDLTNNVHLISPVDRLRLCQSPTRRLPPPSQLPLRLPRKSLQLTQSPELLPLAPSQPLQRLNQSEDEAGEATSDSTATARTLSL